MILNVVAGWTLFLGLLICTGAVVARIVILPRFYGADEALNSWALREAVRVGTIGAWITAFGVLAAFARQFVEFRDPFGTVGEELTLLLSTDWADTWFWGAAAAALLIVGFRLAGTKPALGWPLATLAALALDAFPGATGHAAAASGRGLAMLADTAHVVAAGAWIGTLGLILALERRRPGLGVEGNPSLLGRLVPLFSPVAMVGVGFLAASGIYAAWRELEAVSDLWLTGYGRLLVLKLLLVASVLALGAWNWRRLTPRLSNEEGQSAMRRAATTEFLIANLVLVITALLIRTSPGGH